VNSQNTIIAIIVTLSASLAFAEDFKTINGKEYKDATVSRVEPDGIVLRTKSGISKVYFVELPKEIQERFHYDAKPTLTPPSKMRRRERRKRRQEALSLHHRKIKRQPLSRFTGSEQFVVMVRKAVQLDAGLAHVMAVLSVGNFPMVPAANRRTRTR
jgi:hypothetical protein